jgi:hypothetical protein
MTSSATAQAGAASAPSATEAGAAPSGPVPRSAGGGSDRFTWGIAAGVVLLVIAGLVSVALLQRRAPPPDVSRPDGVVRAYVEAIDTGRPDRAWDLLAAAARTDVSREEFLRRAASLGQRPASRLAIERVDVEGDVARVEVSRTYTVGPIFGPAPVERTTVRLIREQGQWRIEVPPEPWLISRDPRMSP